jgi:hypothetical protein
MSCASSGHITKLKQPIFAPFDIYELTHPSTNIGKHYIFSMSIKIVKTCRRLKILQENQLRYPFKA